MPLNVLVRSLVRRLRRARVSYTPLVEVRISRSRLLENFKSFQRAFPSRRYAPVLKSNAYGHGLVSVAKIFKTSDAPFFVVDTYAEALVLRNEQITKPLLVIGYTRLENIFSNRLKDIAFTIGNLDDLTTIVQIQKNQIAIHLKVDTGMHRQGIMPHELSRALSLLHNVRTVRLEGMGTHLADADGSDATTVQRQISIWNTCASDARRVFPDMQFFHCSATEGAKFSDTIDANVVRLGMGLYGCTSASGVDVVPALEMRSMVTSVRKISHGEQVGYNFTYTAPRDMVVATVPVGYAEGVDRRLSNTGFLSIRNIPCPIVGRVSMNITSIDVTDVDPPVLIGEEVVVISNKREDPNSCESMARQCATIPYEILIHIPSSLRRIVVE